MSCPVLHIRLKITAFFGTADVLNKLETNLFYSLRQSSAHSAKDKRKLIYNRGKYNTVQEKVCWKIFHHPHQLLTSRIPFLYPQTETQITILLIEASSIDPTRHFQVYICVTGMCQVKEETGVNGCA